jgi:zinc D-Ala-D-Ala carboxypeptidase
MTLPGYSDHSNISNCAIDFTHLGNEYGRKLDNNGRLIHFEDTIEFRWLLEHAPEFGFWLPYYPGNSEGIIFEPWHWKFAVTQILQSH